MTDADKAVLADVMRDLETMREEMKRLKAMLPDESTLKILAWIKKQAGPAVNWKVIEGGLLRQAEADNA